MAGHLAIEVVILVTKIRHGGASYTVLNDIYLRLDGTNQPTANYSWTINLTTTGTLQGGTVTDGVATMTGGVVTATTFTDGTLTITGGNMVGAGNITAGGTIQGGTITDGTFSVTGGVITGATNTNWDLAYAHRVPTGGIIAFGGAWNSIPAGFLSCDGSAVSRATYATLFGVIGTNFGIGDGVTTFNLPNFIDRAVKGAPAATSGGATGGAATHAHNFHADTNTKIVGLDGVPSRSIRVSCGTVCTVFKNCETYSHRFCVNCNTSVCSSWPPYQEAVWIIKT